MCDYISWIEKGDEILFLTGPDVFSSQRGSELQNHCKSKDDLTGHGAIRWFYGIGKDVGKERECTNFSTPANFPKQIVKAIKKGQMWGFGEVPRGILTPALYADYKAKRAPLDADYNAKTNALYADYNAKTNALYADYWALVTDANNRAPAWR